MAGCSWPWRGDKVYALRSERSRFKCWLCPLLSTGLGFSLLKHRMGTIILILQWEALTEAMYMGYFTLEHAEAWLS